MKMVNSYPGQSPTTRRRKGVSTAVRKAFNFLNGND